MKNPHQPRILTPAQIDANRERAKKSTGPRTAQGKAASSRNRLLHGLRANKTILVDGEAPEDFLILLKDLDDRFQPAGEGEEMLVARIAADQWRLERTLPLEAGFYRDRLQSVAAADYSLKRGLVNHKRNYASNPDTVPPPPAPPDEGDRLARAFDVDCSNRNSLTNLNRYKTSIERSIDRSLRQLKIYQAARIASELAAAPEVERPAPPAQAAQSAATPQESTNYHSNPRNEGNAPGPQPPAASPQFPTAP